MLKFSVVTPCFNAEKWIEETILSVLNQNIFISKKAELEYIICDGGSRDKTIHICESLCKDFDNISIKILSQEDSGMYDALSRGLNLASGDIISYINAGDFYNLHAFEVVLDIFETKDVKWLTGCRVIYNESSQVVYSNLPFKYRGPLLRCGYYGTKFPNIQQESTFWASDLNSLIDFDRLPSFKLAGDFYLWSEFSKIHELKIVESHLGGWRIHRGQQSEDIDLYVKEMKEISEYPRLQDILISKLDQLLWLMPSKVKKRFNQFGLFRFDSDLGKWN